jgi:hypothetical protein
MSCGQKLSAPGSLAGRRVPCPKCQAPIDVPAAQPMFEPAMAIPEVVPESRPHAVALQPATAPSAARLNPMPPTMPRHQADDGFVDLGLSDSAAPTLAPRPVARPSTGVTAPMITVAALLLLMGGAFGAWLMLSGKGSAGSDLKYLPDDSDFIISADVNGIIASDAGQKVKAKLGDFLAAINKMNSKDSNIKPEDTGRITVGIRAMEKHAAGVVHINRPISDQEFREMQLKGTGTNVGSYQAVILNNALICKIDDHTFVAGDEPIVRKMIARNAPATISDDLTAAMAEVDFSKSFVMAGSLKNLANLGGPGRMPMGPMGMPGMNGIRGGALQADVGSDIRLKAILLCKDSATADRFKAMADAGISMAKMQAGNPQMPPQAARAMKILDTLDISSSAGMLRASLTLDVDTILDMMPAGFGKQLAERATAEAASSDAPAGVPTQVNPLAPPKAPFARQDAAKVLGLKPALAAPGAPNAADIATAVESNPAFQPMDRTHETNNLKQIALAIQNYADKNNRLPPAAIADKNGRLLLSWRVAILPYLGTYEQSIYKRFKLDEPWDGPHNKRLVNSIPPAFMSPGMKQLPRGKTCVLAPVGDKLAFDQTDGRTLADFTDGLSNTIMIVEAAPDRAVEWTRPRDFELDENEPAAGLFGQRKGGALAAFADGSVKFIPQTTAKDVLHALFTINGGEKVPADF